MTKRIIIRPSALHRLFLHLARSASAVFIRAGRFSLASIRVADRPPRLSCFRSGILCGGIAALPKKCIPAAFKEA